MRFTPYRRGAVAVAFALLTAAASSADAQLARELGLVDNGTATPEAASAVLPTGSAFALEQLRHERVRRARTETRFQIKQLFHQAGIRYPAEEIFLRIFKRERTLELWVRPEHSAEFALLRTYDICALAGELGPKRRQGDQQVPEGFYTIDFFNPTSDYHLSLHLDYPNRFDRAGAPAGTDLGGDIFIHGGCNSEGCLALTDQGIRELYWIAVEARGTGQNRIPVHIFPARLEDQDLALLNQAFADQDGLPEFWNALKPGYDFFQQNRRLPVIGYTGAGMYTVNGTPYPVNRPAAVAAPLRAPLGSPLGSPVKAAADTMPRPLGKPGGG